jgi:hypothetical protein
MEATYPSHKLQAARLVGGRAVILWSHPTYVKVDPYIRTPFLHVASLRSSLQPGKIYIPDSKSLFLLLTSLLLQIVMFKFGAEKYLTRHGSMWQFYITFLLGRSRGFVGHCVHPLQEPKATPIKG